MNKLPGDYVAGFIDGEGCFFLTYRKETKRNRPGNPKYYRWSASFAMTLREDDVEILKQIRDTLECGNVYFLNTKDDRAGKQAYFGVQSIDDAHNKVLPFFIKFPLRAKKKHDFELWSKALGLIYRKKKNREPYTAKDHDLLKEIRTQMKAFKHFKQKTNREYRNSPIS